MSWQRQATRRPRQVTGPRLRHQPEAASALYMAWATMKACRQLWYTTCTQ